MRSGRLEAKNRGQNIGAEAMGPQQSSARTKRPAAVRRQGPPKDDYDLSFGLPRSFKESIRPFIEPNYFAIAWQLFNNLKNGLPDAGRVPKDPYKAFLYLFKKHNIRSILDLGCGDRPYFLTTIAPLAREAGIELFGINLEPIKRDGVPEGINLKQGDAGYASAYPENKKFDLVICSGVVADIQLMCRQTLFGPTRLSLKEAVQNATGIILQGLERLSDNPAAAMYMQSFNSSFLLYRDALVKKRVDILYWNNQEMKTRPETGSEVISRNSNTVIGNYKSDRSDDLKWEIEEFRRIWQQSANIAVLAKGHGFKAGKGQVFGP